MLVLKDGEIYTPEEVIKGNILIEEGQIKEIGDCPIPKGAEVIDLEGKIVAPGFIDIHTHGLYGHDSMDGQSAIEEISRGGSN